MTRHTWTAFVSAFVFVGLAVLLVVVPVPFVSWTPGGTRDTLGNVGSEPIIKISRAQTYPTTGRLDMTVVSVTPADARLSLPQALLSYWLPHRDTLPRDAVYAAGKSAEEVESEDADLMETAQDDAVVAALRADNQPVTEMAVVSSVTVGGPAHKLLLPGDLVTSVDGRPTDDAAAVSRLIRAHKVDQKVTFGVIRDKVPIVVQVQTAESPTQADVPVVGILLDKGYRYEPDISFDIGQKIGGPSAGLVFALAIYDKLTPGELLAGHHVAGTGSISPAGDVGSIGGVQEKIAGAEKAGATVFLVPAENCADLAGATTTMTLVKVSTLTDAITAMGNLDSPAELPHLLMADPISPNDHRDALVATLIELDRHLGAAGWDQPTRLFGLVLTDVLAEAEPELAADLKLRTTADGGSPGALTAIEQEDFATSGDLIADLASLEWPETVFGCAVSTERSFLPAAYEDQIPDDPTAAAYFLAGHPARQDLRVVVGADRLGNRHGVARVASQPEELLGGEDLVPGLASVLARTLASSPAGEPQRLDESLDKHPTGGSVSCSESKLEGEDG